MRLLLKLTGAAAVLIPLYFFGLTGAGLLGPDEPRYAAIGREMALSGDWITPRLWGEPWFEKPALLYWLIGMAWAMDLGPDLAPRAPVALVSVAFLIFFFLWMRREWGRTAAAYAVIILATSVGWIAYSRIGVTDLPLAATFAASMLLALPWVRSGGRRGLLVGGVLLGLAILAKGLVPIVLAAPLAWVGRRRWRDLLMFGAAALLMAAPWYILCYAQNGYPFIEVFFVRHHFGRFVSEQLQHVQPWWYYVPVLLGLMFPWLPALPAIRRVGWSDVRVRLLLGWLVWGFLFFSFSTNKLPGYVLPLLPAIAALAGIGLAQKPVSFAAAGTVALLALVPIGAAVLPEAVASGLSRASADGIQYGVVSALLLAAIGVALIERSRVRLAFGAATVIASAAFVWLIAVSYPDLDRTASARPVWREIQEEGIPECIDSPSRAIRYGLNYYAGRALPSCTASRERNHDNLDRE